MTMSAQAVRWALSSTPPTSPLSARNDSRADRHRIVAAQRGFQHRAQAREVVDDSGVGELSMRVGSIG